MKRIISIGSLFFASGILFVACGTNQAEEEHIRSQGGVVSESYSYQFSENGCDTSKQSFSSMAAYCNGLADSSLNHGCALELRRQAFAEKQCPGSFESASSVISTSQSPLPDLKPVMPSGPASAVTPVILMFFRPTNPLRVDIVLNESRAGDLKAIVQSLDKSGSGMLSIRRNQGDVTISCKSMNDVTSCTFNLIASGQMLIDGSGFISRNMDLHDFSGVEALLETPNWTIPASFSDGKGRTLNWSMGNGKFSIDGRDGSSN